MPEAQNAAPVISNSMLNIKIVEQIEYYFGDFNMMKDKFLRQEITKNDGWVPVKTLLSFNRLAALSKDIDIILVAFSDHHSTLVEVNNHTKCIRRNPNRPLPDNDETWRASVTERTIYIKGFPLEGTTVDNVITFLQPFGKIDNIFMRNYRDKALKQWKFKGSVFVAFPSREDAERFLSIGSMKYEGKDLIRKWQKDYIEEKKNERQEAKLKAKELKSKLLQEQRDTVKQEMKQLPTGALIELSGLNEKIHLSQLKSKLLDMDWDVAFIDYTSGQPTALVRLQNEGSAKILINKLKDEEFELQGFTLQASLVEGEKEKEALQVMEAERESKIMENMMKAKGKKKGKKFSKYHNIKQGKRSEASNVDVKAEPEVTIKTESMESGDDNTLKRKHDDASESDSSKKPKAGSK